MSRQARIVVLSAWPGLAQIWSGQEILGILLGAFFAAVLNVAMVARWIWPEALPPGSTDFFATLAGVTWVAGSGYTIWWIHYCHPERHHDEIDRLLREAQENYLRGQWAESQRRIERILTMDETDSDALMHLGTLYVRTQQPTLARRTFRQCLDSKHGAKWRWEIQQTLARMDAGAAG